MTPQLQPLPDLLTPTDLADYLGVHHNTLYTWRRTGRGPHFTRMGGQIRYPYTAVIRWLETRETPTEQ